MKEDVFMALPVSGGIYTFQCLGAENMFLNLYYYSGISNGQNVILWDGDGSKEQQWKFDGKKLLPVRDTSFALDKYTVAGNPNNNNADVWEANDPTNQNIVFESTNSGSNVVRIKLASSNMYLTAYGLVHGTNDGKTPTSKGNVFWAPKKTSTMQQWVFTKVGGSSSGGHPEQNLAVPINHAKIQCGYHNPQKTPASQWQQCPLYSTLGSFAKAGHFGMDLTGTVNPFYASGNGVVLGLSKNANNVIGKWLAIKYYNVKGYGDIIARYFHLNDIFVSVDQEVNLNTLIATYGATGNYVTGAHLHVELDTDTKAWNYTPTLSADNGGLCAGIRGSQDTTLNPAYVFKLKTSEPENQTMTYPETGWYSGPHFDTF